MRSSRAKVTSSREDYAKDCACPCIDTPDPTARARSRAGGRVAAMFELLLATHNAKKLAELRRIVEAAALGVRVVGLVDVTGYSEPE